MRHGHAAGVSYRGNLGCHGTTTSHAPPLDAPQLAPTRGGKPLAFLTFGPNDEPAFGMSLVPGRQRVGPTDNWRIWFEATGPSTTAGDIVFTLTGDSHGPPARDVVRAKLNAAPNMNDQTRNVCVGPFMEARHLLRLRPIRERSSTNSASNTSSTPQRGSRSKPRPPNKIETFYVDVDYYQSWFVRGRNWWTGAIDDSRYGEQTPTIPDKVNFGAVR